MIRDTVKFEKAITTLTDVLSIFLAYVLSVYIRYYIMQAEPGLDLLSVPYLLIAAAYSLIMASVMSYLRRVQETRQGGRAHIGVMTINAFGCLGYLAFLYTIGEIYFSRWAMLLFWILSSVFLVFKELVLDIILDRKMKALTRRKRVLVVGEGGLALDYLRAVGFDASCDFTIIGYVGNRSTNFFENDFESDGRTYGLGSEKDADPSDGTSDITRRGWLGQYEDLDIIIEKTVPDEVVFALEDDQITRLPRLLEITRKRHTLSSIVTGFNKYIPRNAAVRSIDNMRVIDLSGEDHVTAADAGMEKLGVILSSIFLLIILMMQRFGIGDADNLRMYEVFRYVVFGVLGACVFMSLENLVKGRKHKYIIDATVSIVICTVAAWIYECFYTMGVNVSDHVVSDLKMILLFVCICCAARMVEKFIGKDNAFFYF